MPEVSTGTLTLTRLKTEGRLQRGDILTHTRLGELEFVNANAVHTITVRRIADGQHFRLSGLNFGADARCVDVTAST